MLTVTDYSANTVAIMKPARPLHLEIQTHRPNPVGLIRSSYRDNGKVKHSTHGRLTGLSLEQLRLIRAAFNQEVIPRGSPEAFQITASKEYGASAAVLSLAKELELDRLIYSRAEPWVKDVLAMVVGRLGYAGSKLSLSHLWPQTALWELCGVEGAVDVDRHCYEPMDRLLERQGAIQQALAQRHLSSGQAVLYDVTSTYFEGEYEFSQLVCFGYNRDGKRGHEQITLGLVCTPTGCPVAVEVFAGNTPDAKSVPEKIRQLQEDYGIKELIFVGDRGMITRASYEKIKGREGLATITALTHPDLVQLLARQDRGGDRSGPTADALLFVSQSGDGSPGEGHAAIAVGRDDQRVGGDHQGQASDETGPTGSTRGQAAGQVQDGKIRGVGSAGWATAVAFGSGSH